MGIATDATHFVTAHAERLPRSIVAARTRRRIATRFTPVQVLGDAEPTSGMRAAAIRPRD
jgi:hypothetical protein